MSDGASCIFRPGSSQSAQGMCHYLLYSLHVSAGRIAACLCVKNHCTCPYLCLCPCIGRLIGVTTMCSYLDVIRGPLGQGLCGVLVECGLFCKLLCVLIECEWMSLCVDHVGGTHALCYNYYIHTYIPQPVSSLYLYSQLYLCWYEWCAWITWVGGQ